MSRGLLVYKVKHDTRFLPFSSRPHVQAYPRFDVRNHVRTHRMRPSMDCGVRNGFGTGFLVTEERLEFQTRQKMERHVVCHAMDFTNSNHLPLSVFPLPLLLLLLQPIHLNQGMDECHSSHIILQRSARTTTDGLCHQPGQKFSPAWSSTLNLK